MRIAVTSFGMLLVASQLFAQPRPRMLHAAVASQRVQSAEVAVKQAMEDLAEAKKVAERDLKVFAHLRAADDALADTMQPANAIGKAFEQVSEAERLVPDFLVQQGVLRIRQELESAQRSPGTADFGHLRAVLRGDAMGPAARVVVRNAMSLQQDALSWIKVQQLIADHLRELSEITGESLRAVER